MISKIKKAIYLIKKYKIHGDNINFARRYTLDSQKWSSEQIKDESKLIERNCPVCNTDNKNILLNTPVYAFVKCTKCGLVYANKILNGSMIEEFYRDNEIYQRIWSKSYDILVKSKDIVQCKSIIDTILKYRSGNNNCLEIGCGHGKLLYELKPYFKEVEGVELNEMTSKQGEKLFDIKIHNDFLENLNLPSNSYDVVILNQVIEHIDNFDMFKEIYRILKPNGIVYIGCPNADGWSMKLFKDKHIHISHSHVHENMFNKKSMESFAKNYKFKVKKNGTDNCLDINFIDLIYYFFSKNFIHRHNYNPILSPISLVTEKVLGYLLNRTNLLCKLGGAVT